MHDFGRMSSYEQYPEEKSRLWLSKWLVISCCYWNCTYNSQQQVDVRKDVRITTLLIDRKCNPQSRHLFT